MSSRFCSIALRLVITLVMALGVLSPSAKAFAPGDEVAVAGGEWHLEGALQDFGHGHDHDDGGERHKSGTPHHSADHSHETLSLHFWESMSCSLIGHDWHSTVADVVYMEAGAGIDPPPRQFCVA